MQERGVMQPPKDFDLSCPIPLSDYPNVLLAHGGGGRLMHQLIDRMFLAAFDNPLLAAHHDGALIDLPGLQANLPATKLAFTTDSYVVRPLFFPGGDIGALAVNGTVNDLAMCGARPLYLSAGFILEEGLPIETLWQVTQSMRRAAEAARVQLVTGDTKVVDRGKGDGIYINTAGIGVIKHPFVIAPASVRAGDAVLLSGDIGRHGIAIMAVREGLAFETQIQSDCAPLADMVAQLVEAGLEGGIKASIELHCLRDLTRGGLASALIEIAEAACVDIRIEEKSIPIQEDVQAACEILGLDPLYVANEGRFIAFVPASDAERAVTALRSNPLGADAGIIGRVENGSGLVTLKNRIGTTRIVDMLSGEQLPRIC